MTGIGSPRRLASPDEVVGLEPDDEGLGNIRPDEVVGLEPDDSSHSASALRMVAG
jgi:hypothetical protein